MKSTFLKAIKTVALSLTLSLGVSGVVLANGAGVSPTKAVALNGAGNGAGNGVGRTTKRKVAAKRKMKRRARRGITPSTTPPLHTGSH